MKLKFQLLVISLKGIAFEDAVESVYLTGEDGEFELLAFHHPLIAALPEGDIRIADHASIPIKVGVISFHGNQCRVVAEIDPHFENYKQIWNV